MVGTAQLRSCIPQLVALPVRGVLCFVEADWPLIGGSFRIEGIEVCWPKKTQEHLLAGGPLSDAQVEAVHRHLARAFPSAGTSAQHPCL